jgi:hypothetical protein
MPIQIEVINESTVLKDSDAKAAVDALQKQVSNDFFPVWGLDASVNFVSRNAPVSADAWQLVLLDNADQAGVLGYHDVTANGLPLGKVFAATDLQYGSSWTNTLSHEALEMLADPDINLTVLVDDTRDRRGWLYAYEVCDACEADNLGYEIDGVLLSDFVYPSWFESFRAPSSAQFDHMRAISEPFQLAPGGYISVLRVGNARGWQEITARSEPYTRRPPVGSRRERRRLDREQWRRSERRLN